MGSLILSRFLLFLLGIKCDVNSFTFLANKQIKRSSLSKLYAFDLETAFQWLADERENFQSAYSTLSWLDPASTSSNNITNNISALEIFEMPLYPIGATYMPSNTNHTLNNVKKRNIQMALDVDNFKGNDGRFCVVLYCIDTGRIAKVGTVMSIVDMDIQRDPGDEENIRRIQVTCRPQATVDIDRIMNPQAYSWESKLRDKPEYLKAQVRYREDMEMTKEEEGIDETISTILENYNTVRNLYLNGTGTQYLLPFAVEALEDGLPEWTASNLVEDFWLSLEQWQTLCQTIRHCQLVNLSSDVNEIKIAAMRAKDGYLNLPIHMEDLPKETREKIQNMEGLAQEKYIRIGMDPCLDFQVLLSLPTFREKLEFLSTMIARERRRLESMPDKLPTKLLEDPEPKKGAWFDDAAWE